MSQLNAQGLKNLAARLSRVPSFGSMDDRMTVVRAQVELERAAETRILIQSAPHAYECFADFASGSDCTCWKAEVP